MTLAPKQWFGVGLLGLVVGTAILVAKAPTPPELIRKPEPEPEAKKPLYTREGDVEGEIVDAEFQVLTG